MNYNKWILMLVMVCFSMVDVVAESTLKDPTKPPKKQAPKRTVVDTKLKLNSVIISAERKVAIINGEIVREDETFADAIVRSIEPNGVILRGPKGDIVMKLWEEAIIHEQGTVEHEAIFPDVKKPVGSNERQRNEEPIIDKEN